MGLGLAFLLGASSFGCKKNAETQAPEPAATAPSAAAADPNKPGVLGKNAIRGKVTFTGKAPEARPLKRDADPFCAKTQMNEEDILVAPSGGLKNVFVKLTQGVQGVYAPPSQPAEISQRDCMYRPRVLGVMAGQQVAIKNDDQTLHNVHGYKGASTIFNQAQIPGMAPMPKVFTDAGQVLKFRCDVHPWMTGYVGVSSHPFFAVSEADGSFAIPHVPPGKYTVEAWHERLGTRSAEVTVEDDKPAEVSFAFAMP
jgi:plastocyanin